MIGNGFIGALANKVNSVLATILGTKTSIVQVPYVPHQDTMMAFIRTGYYHVHGASFIYPDKAAPITLTSGAGAWDETGTIVEILPANTITKDFDLHWASLSAISAELDGIIDIFKDVAGSWVKIGPLTDVVRTTNFSREGDSMVQVPQIPANTRLGARFSDSTTSARTVRLKIKGHVYGTSL